MEVNMRRLKTIFTLLSVVVVGFAVMAMTNVYQHQKPKPWDVPAKYKEMKNPVKVSDANNKVGEAAYKKNCASCHGKTGLGDGVKARTLKDFPGDFSSVDFQKQTDGDHFYKTKFGRTEMPKFDKKIPDEDIWSIVNYMRTFKK
jgi:mono/diheme cytochrome c family protein